MWGFMRQLRLEFDILINWLRSVDIFGLAHGDLIFYEDKKLRLEGPYELKLVSIIQMSISQIPS